MICVLCETTRDVATLLLSREAAEMWRARFGHEPVLEHGLCARCAALPDATRISYAKQAAKRLVEEMFDSLTVAKKRRGAVE